VEKNLTETPFSEPTTRLNKRRRGFSKHSEKTSGANGEASLGEA
jgi:hypothetical protein